MGSGLYARLVQDGLLVQHVDIGLEQAQTTDAYTVIQPALVSFISYPYEWCFGQLKAAALATLNLQRNAIECGMSLKDASAYNMQFVQGKPCLIDTLSFEIYRDGIPWTAYRQFCQHFLAPLTLMAYCDVRLGQLLRTHLDGIPLELAASLLPISSRLKPTLLLHLFLHAAAQKRLSVRNAIKERKRRSFDRRAMLGLVDSLETAIRGLRWEPSRIGWTDYVPEDGYGEKGVQHKKELVAEFLKIATPHLVWDLGANTGEFSRLASRCGIFTIAFDNDPGVVELNYRRAMMDDDKALLPLLMDITNPSPSLGWENQEREAWLERNSADVVLALALVHHLAVGCNVPLDRLADFFARLGRWLIVEFVPKTDLRVQQLLAVREDIFVDYTREGFECAFARFFSIRRVEQIVGSERTIFLMEKF